MLKTLRTLSIRAKLMWIVLALLVIPWMGYQYVQEMKRFLVQGQKDALLLTANGIATILNDHSELFDPETGVPEVLGEESDLYAHELDNLINLDGESADWSTVQQYANYYTGNEFQVCNAEYDPHSFSSKSIIGYYEQYLYVLFEINDDHLVHRDLDRVSLDSSDQIRMLLQPPEGALEHYLLVAPEAGRMSTFLVDENWQVPLEGSDVTAFTAELAETEWGYRIELRIPRDVVGRQSKIGFFAVDVDDPETREVVMTVPVSPQISDKEPSQILIASPELEQILKGLDRPQSRIWILDNLHRVRAVVGGFSVTPPLQNVEVEEGRNRIITLYDNLRFRINTIFNPPPPQFTDVSVDVALRPDKIFTTILNGTPAAETRPSLDGEEEIIVAGHPIHAGNEILGAVVVEQSSRAILARQYQLLRSLTVVTTVVFFFVLIVLFIFAWRLTVRVRRLLSTTDQAITTEGRVLEDKIPTRIYPTDELGNLGRSITNMLHRLSGYTRYLERMPDTLAHEMNNPLNVVSSSLQNLGAESPQIEKNRHMQRALNGVNRLRIIVNNLTEAANLEEAMRDEIREPIKLAALVSEFVAGYRSSLPQQKFILDIRDNSTEVKGSPDYLAQMLDKLIDNAVGFSMEKRPIIVRVGRNQSNIEISVLNEGDRLPEGINSDRLFEPMTSYGKANAQHSHLGLGLFVVRLIVEYHQGRVWAENRIDTSGVKVTASIPVYHRQPYPGSPTGMA